MKHKAKLIATGEIIEVSVEMDYHGNTTYLDAATNTEYCPSELKFQPDPVDQTDATIRILSQFPDTVLRAELKRRSDERKPQRVAMKHCRDCKHCIEGYSTNVAVAYGHKTFVCDLKRKPSAYPCYYSAPLSRQACEMFEPTANKKK